MLHLILGFVIPSLFLPVGAIAKVLFSSPLAWKWEDAYLGIELTLASLTVCTLNICDLQRLGDKYDQEQQRLNGAQTEQEKKDDAIRIQLLDEQKRDVWQEQGRTIACWALAFFAFLFVGTLHRQWVPKSDGWAKRWMLAGLGNFCGYCPMVCYMLFAKGVG